MHGPPTRPAWLVTCLCAAIVVLGIPQAEAQQGSAGPKTSPAQLPVVVGGQVRRREAEAAYKAGIDAAADATKLKAFAEAIRHDPTFHLSYLRRAEILIQTADYPAGGLAVFAPARAELDSAVRAAPQEANVWAARASLRDIAQDPDGAIADYGEAIRLPSSRTAIYLFERALIHDAAHRMSDALADIADAIRRDPRLAPAYGLRALIRGNAGDEDGVVADTTAALRLVSTFAPGRSDIFASKAELDAAVAPLGYMADFASPDQLYERRAAAHRKAGRIALAEADERARESSKRDAGIPAVSAAAGAVAAAASPAPGAVAPPRAAPVPAPAPAAASPPAPAIVAALPPAPLAAVTPPGSRVALVMGNGAYAGGLSPLPNPANDARDMAAALRALGFEVTLAVDSGRTEMEAKIAAFAMAARRSDVALAFYAGHGLQHQGINYLAPVDAIITDETDLRRRFVKVQDLIEELQNAKGARILLLDACRDNEAIRQLAAVLPRSRSVNVRGGLAGEKAEGILIAFATQANATAADGDNTRNSPFTAAMLKHLPTPGQDIRMMLTRVRADVLKSTGGLQRPEVSDSLDGEFAFR